MGDFPDRDEYDAVTANFELLGGAVDLDPSERERVRDLYGQVRRVGARDGRGKRPSWAARREGPCESFARRPFLCAVAAAQVAARVDGHKGRGVRTGDELRPSSQGSRRTIP